MAFFHVLFLKPIDPHRRLSHRHANQGMFSRHVPMEWRVFLMPKAENVRVTFGGVAGDFRGLGWCVGVCHFCYGHLLGLKYPPWFNVDKEAIHVYEGANTNLSELHCLPNRWSFLWKPPRQQILEVGSCFPPNSWGSGFFIWSSWDFGDGTPIWNPPTTPRCGSLGGDLPRPGGSVRSSCFSPDGEKILAAVHWALKRLFKFMVPSVGSSGVADMTGISGKRDTEHRINPFNKRWFAEFGSAFF